MQVDRLHKIKKSRVLIYGDFMVDKYIIGSVKRISPEAPVPILEVTGTQSKLGGAGNVVNNIMTMGAATRVIGCVGNDSNGEWIKNRLREKGADIEFLRCAEDVKTRIISKNQQYMRLDEEVIQDISDEYSIYIKENIDKVLDGITVVIISDYAKGAITKDLAQFIIKEANDRKIKIVVDPKGKDYSKYYGATVCTPNINELSVVSDMELLSEEDIVQAGQRVKKDVNLTYLLLTRSEKGISIFKDNNIKQDFPAIEKDVVDVTGAGDTVVSMVALCLGIGYSIEDSCILANFAASVVCSKFGAATVSMNELLESINYSGEFKVIDANVAKYIVKSLKEKGKKVVFTNGCFDLVHAGHISSFKQAKLMGDVLIVAVNSDASVKRLKGEKRPVIDQANRMKMLCALECVDYVILMEDDTPVNLIQDIEPDIAVKGRDWEGKDIPEKKVVEGYGGEMCFIELEQGLSTTSIIGKILESNR